MTARSPERAQFLADLLTTAVEGGINYWAQVSDYRWVSPGLRGSAHTASSDGSDDETVTHADASVTVWEMDKQGDDDEYPADYKGVHVTIDTIASALTKYRAWEHKNPSLLLADRTNGDDGDYDAGDADNVMQFAVLGEVVYG